METQLTINDVTVLTRDLSESVLSNKQIFVGLLIYYLLMIVMGRFLGNYGVAFFIFISLCLWLYLILFWDIENILAAYIAFLMTFRTMAEWADVPDMFEKMVIVLSFALILNLCRKGTIRKPGKTGKVVFMIYGLFALSWIISAFINQISIVAMATSGMWCFYGIILFVTVYFQHSFDPNILYQFSRMVTLLLLLQIPIQIWQASTGDTYNLLWGVKAYYGVHPDYVYGTFGYGGTKNLGIIFQVASYGAIVYTIAKGFSLRSIGILTLILGVSFVGTYMADIGLFRAAILIAPPIILVLFVLAGNFRSKKFKLIATACFLIPALIIGSMALAEKYVHIGEGLSRRLDASTGLFSFDRWENYLTMVYYNEKTGKFELGRLTALGLSYEQWMNAETLNFIFGMGPDSFRESWFEPYGMDRFLAEMGFLGIAIYLSLLAYMFYRVLIFIRHSKEHDLQLWGLIYLCTLFTFVITGQYEGGWFYPYQKGMIFWFLTAIVIRWCDEMNNDMKVI